jgi:hypothetical protein
VETPGAAVEAAVSVNLLLPLPGAARLAGAKLAVTPLGSPVAEKAIGALKPPEGVVVIVTGIDPPGVRLMPAAPRVTAKLGVTTVRVRGCVLVSPPPVAVMMRVDTLAPTLEPAEIVKVLLPLPGAVMLVGAKFAVTPLGRPDTDRAMAELNPFPTVVVKVICAELPVATLAFEGLADNVKVAKTVKLSVWVLVIPPPVAVTVKLAVPAAAVEVAESVRTLLPVPGAAI